MNTTAKYRTLLGVWAHPDDEAYLSAGLMLDFVGRGGRVVVVTATSGEHGTADRAQWPPDRLAVRRRGELRDSLAILGVTDVRILGDEDGRCAERDGSEDIGRVIAEVAPDLIVTFGPDGMTGHPDHRAISRWTTDAWHAGGRRADLWYATVTPDFHDEWHDVNEEIGLWAEQPTPPCTLPADLAHAIELPDRQLDLKLAALRAHESQSAGLIQLLGERAYRRWWSTEAFRAATAGDVHLSTVSSQHLVGVAGA
jgi:LmbE family N-acetylglucosaminyl deacetylase